MMNKMKEILSIQSPPTLLLRGESPAGCNGCMHSNSPPGASPLPPGEVAVSAAGEDGACVAPMRRGLSPAAADAWRAKAGGSG